MPKTPTLRAALAEAVALGLRVSRVHRTGEVRVRDPLEPSRPVTVNARRKDASRKLLVLLRRARCRR